ncbi:hypothetical protein [Variovorax sp. SRS16]|uniref:hypothetical protein n=1 Tax=Variovorax sp. SRS16 TaxID=282217 RepID=UPI0013A557EB|nr:hypothetical protein [Variovorax sp. SRS16]
MPGIESDLTLADRELFAKYVGTPGEPELPGESATTTPTITTTTTTAQTAGTGAPLPSVSVSRQPESTVAHPDSDTASIERKPLLRTPGLSGEEKPPVHRNAEYDLPPLPHRTKLKSMSRALSLQQKEPRPKLERVPRQRDFSTATRSPRSPRLQSPRPQAQSPRSPELAALSRSRWDAMTTTKKRSEQQTIQRYKNAFPDYFTNAEDTQALSLRLQLLSAGMHTEIGTGSGARKMVCQQFCIFKLVRSTAHYLPTPTQDQLNRLVKSLAAPLEHCMKGLKAAAFESEKTQARNHLSQVATVVIAQQFQSEFIEQHRLTKDEWTEVTVQLTSTLKSAAFQGLGIFRHNSPALKPLAALLGPFGAASAQPLLQLIAHRTVEYSQIIAHVWTSHAQQGISPLNQSGMPNEINHKWNNFMGSLLSPLLNYFSTLELPRPFVSILKKLFREVDASEFSPNSDKPIEVLKEEAKLLVFKAVYLRTLPQHVSLLSLHPALPLDERKIYSLTAQILTTMVNGPSGMKQKFVEEVQARVEEASKEVQVRLLQWVAEIETFQDDDSLTLISDP